MISVALALDNIFGPPLVQLAVFLTVSAGLAASFYLSFRSRGNTDVCQRDSQKNKLRLCLTTVVTVGVTIFAIFFCVTLGANKDIDSKLRSGVISVTVEGQPLTSADLFIKALSEPCSTLERRSHPTAKYDVEIETRAGKLTLEIGRDSVLESDYWVFYPRFGLTRENEVRRACNTGLQLN